MHAILGGKPERYGQRRFGGIALIVKFERRLARLRDRQLCLLLRQRQRPAFLHLRLDGVEHAEAAIDIPMRATSLSRAARSASKYSMAARYAASSRLLAVANAAPRASSLACATSSDFWRLKMAMLACA